MKKIVKNFMFPICAVFLMSFNVINAQSGNSNIPLPLDTSIKYGRLSNGFTYYIKHIESPSKKLKMRLYVKVGYYSQESDQMDFAHALEHLAFKAAKDFPVNLLDDPVLLSRLGVAKDDVFGQTSTLYTWYSFDIPFEREDAFDTALLWFYDILDLKLNSDIVNKEKGPLKQELVFRQGDDLHGYFTNTKLESIIFPCRQDYTNFFEFNKSFAPMELIQFYKEWYHPERMALVIVGDTTNIDGIEGSIKSRFSSLISQGKFKSVSHCINKYLNSPNRFVVLERPTSKGIPHENSVEMFLYMRDKETVSQCESLEGLKREVLWDMFTGMINQRFQEVSNIYNSSFSAYVSPPLFDWPAYHIKISADTGKEKAALKMVVKVLKQAREFGFDQKEFEKFKNEKLKALKHTDTTNPGYWLEKIQSHIGYGAALPSHLNRNLSQWLGDLSLSDINAFSEKYVSEIPNDIGIIAPSGQESLSYTQEQFSSYIDQIANADVSAYVVPEIPEYLLSSKEVANLQLNGYTNKGPVKNGVQELVLANGVKVLLQPLEPTVKGRRVMLHGFSSYGASCFPQEDYFSAVNAPSIVLNAGVGEMDKFTLDRFLANTSFWQGVKPYIKYNESGIKGAASLKDFEELLQLVYLYFTQPRKDHRAFADWQTMEKKRYFNPGYSLIQEDFNVAMNETMGVSSKTPLGTKRYQGLKLTDMQVAYKIYQQLFGNASDFTFLFTGGFSAEEVIPLLQKYLGNLPVNPTGFLCSKKIKNEKKLLKGPLYIQFSAEGFGASYNMKSVRYSLRFVTEADDPANWREHIKMDILGTLMDSKIHELRFNEEASLYDMRAMAKFNMESMIYDFQMQLDCVPEELEGLRKKCKEMVSEIKKDGFSQQRFNEVIQHRILPKYSAERQSLNKVQSKTYNHYRYNVPWVSTSEIEYYIKSLGPKDIQKTAQKYLKDKNLTEFSFGDDIRLP